MSIAIKLTQQTLIVNQGDKVTIKFYKGAVCRSILVIIDSLYNVNIDIAQGQNCAASFVADHYPSASGCARRS
jgi:hypothetical protein